VIMMMMVIMMLIMMITHVVMVKDTWVSPRQEEGHQEEGMSNYIQVSRGRASGQPLHTAVKGLINDLCFCYLAVTSRASGH